MSTTVRSPSDIAVPAPAPNHQTRAGGREIVNSPKRLARIAGLLYLFVGIFGGFADGFVDPRMYVAGDAAATAGNVVANAGVVRLGVVAHLLDGAFFIFTALTLFILLKHVQQSVARAMVILVALATGIICLNAVFQFEASRVATDSSYAAAFGIAGANAVALLLLDIQHYGTPHRAGLLWPVAGAARVSRLQIRAIPQVARRGAHHGRCLLPRGPARSVPRTRHRRNHPPVRWHTGARDRRNLHGLLPAHHRREDHQARPECCKSRRAHSRRGVTGTADCRRPVPAADGCGVPTWIANGLGLFGTESAGLTAKATRQGIGGLHARNWSQAFASD